MYRIREVDTFTDEDAVEAIHFFNRQTCAFPILPQDAIDKGWWWLVYLGKEPVGFAGLTKSDYENCGYLKRAGVDHKHRGQGLQRRLIRVRLRKAKLLGFSRVVTETTDTVHSANNLAAEGFKLFDPPHRWLDYRTTLYWTRQL